MAGRPAREKQMLELFALARRTIDGTNLSSYLNAIDPHMPSSATQQQQQQQQEHSGQQDPTSEQHRLEAHRIIAGFTDQDALKLHHMAAKVAGTADMNRSLSHLQPCLVAH